MALKCYFDGSGKQGRSLTLAAVAGDERAWKGLDADWAGFLKHAGVDYSHMYEALARKGPFKLDEGKEGLVRQRLDLLR